MKKSGVFIFFKNHFPSEVKNVFFRVFSAELEKIKIINLSKKYDCFFGVFFAELEKIKITNLSKKYD